MVVGVRRGGAPHVWIVRRHALLASAKINPSWQKPDMADQERLHLRVPYDARDPSEEAVWKPTLE
jgi:hypothetical protein